MAKVLCVLVRHAKKILITPTVRLSSAGIMADKSEVLPKTEKATFSMACFWAPEAQFGCALGVIKTKVGYTGGTSKNPTYRNLSDHTETVQLEFDPNQTTYGNLLDMFWRNHDPMSRSSRQYASRIFYHDENQKNLAQKSKDDYASKKARTVLTEILEAKTFYDAEDYHQKYILKQHPWLCDSLGLKEEEMTNSHVCARLNGYVAGYGDISKFKEEWPKLGLTEDQANYVIKAAASGVSASCGH